MDRQAAVISILIVAIVAAGSFSFAAVHYGNSGHNTAKATNTGSVTVTDSINRTFTFAHPVTRVVSIDPSATATLYALGAFKDLVGGNSFDSYPPNSSLPNVGNSYGINYEEVLNLSPQVVLFYGASLSKEALYINNTLKIPVLLDNPANFAEIENFTHMLGVLTGTVYNSTLINSWMNRSLGMIGNSSHNYTAQENVFYYLSNYGGYWTAGKDTFIGEIFSYLHLKNIATGVGYYSMSGEDIANASPQVIFLDQYVNYSAITQEPFNSTPAFQDNKIYAVFNDNFFDQPDFRIVYAVYWVLTVVFPSSFVNLPSFPINLQYPPTTGF